MLKHLLTPIRTLVLLSAVILPVMVGAGLAAECECDKLKKRISELEIIANSATDVNLQNTELQSSNANLQSKLTESHEKLLFMDSLTNSLRAENTELRDRYQGPRARLKELKEILEERDIERVMLHIRMRESEKGSMMCSHGLMRVNISMKNTKKNSYRKYECCLTPSVKRDKCSLLTN